ERHEDSLLLSGAAALCYLGRCCFEFREKQLPPKRVTGIIRTHQRCQHQAFVVSTVAGREFCFRDNFKWAVDTFNKFNLEESS
uniref:Chemokine interleukin-8-like domain-containing protein n=1 Tax=Oryzias sinensis TaxID=183150 RepID=A0A8C7YF05_9TELE